jgi:thymidylate kinase
MKGLTITHISQVIGFLNEHADYAVLRNFEGLPDRNESRDIDIIITRKSYRGIKRGLIALIEQSGWRIVTYLHSDRLITYVCGRVDGVEAELVQWDFFFDTSMWGIELMSAQEFLATKQFSGFLYYVGIECQFLDKYLYNRFTGGLYPAKYQATREQAEQLPAVVAKVKSLYGRSSVAACDKASQSSLLCAALWNNIKCRPWGLLVNVSRFLASFIGNYFHGTGFSIGFTGPDGSGKTTVIDLMLEQLGDVFRKAHTYFHFRPALFGNLGEVAHSAGIKKTVDREYDKPHRGGRTGVVNSFLRLLYYSVDYVLGYFLRVKPVIRITRLAVFDRYYTDIICDSRRTRIYLNRKFLYRFGRLVIPSLDYNILLTADTEVILARKRELDEAGIRAINEAIDYLKDKPGYLKVENNGTPLEAVAMILNYVFEQQHRRNLKRLQ